MKSQFHLSVVLLLLGVSVSAFAQAKIEGQVTNVRGRPLARIGLVVTPGGQVGRTDSKGQFTILLLGSIPAGIAARIRVQETGWVVFSPMFGQCTTQDRKIYKDRSPIVIVRKGSPYAFGPKGLSAFVDELQRRANRQDKLIGEQSDRMGEFKRRDEQYSFLQEYAREFGLPVEKLKDALDEWAQTRRYATKLDRARKEYWAGNLQRVIELTAEAGPGAIELLNRQNRRQLETSLSVIRLYTYRGNAFYGRYKFAEAAESFTMIDGLFSTKVLSRENLLSEWAENKISLGDAKRRLAEEVLTEKSLGLLREALVAYRESQAIFTQEQTPQKWADIEWSRAVALLTLGKQLGGDEGARYFNDSVTAFNATLTVSIDEQSRVEWASTQSGLGGVFFWQGIYTGGPEGIKLLKQAIAAQQAALSIRTRKEFPQDWAETQNNLCTALIALGRRTPGSQGLDYLNSAVTACKAALEVHTRESYRVEWGMAYNNLGVSLMRIGERLSGAESVRYLNSAVEAYHHALEVRTREEVPREWQLTQNNLAKTYFALKDWARASEAYASLIEIEPEEGAYDQLTLIYQNKLFEFDKAFSLNQRWLAQHEDDLTGQANFAESNLTIGRFREGSHLSNTLLSRRGVTAGDRIRVRAIEIASLLADRQAGQVPSKINALIEDVSRQPVEFKIVWDFDGLRHFIGQDQRLSSYGEWLRQLFDALAEPDRDTMIKALQEVRAKF